jgi:hypothetical protein
MYRYQYGVKTTRNWYRGIGISRFPSIFKRDTQENQGFFIIGFWPDTVLAGYPDGYRILKIAGYPGNYG